MFATFALGTALGDYAAIALHLGYPASVVVVGVAITVPALARWGFGVNAVVAFWSAYVITHPLGPSVAHYLSKPRSSAAWDLGTARRLPSSPLRCWPWWRT